ncbi:helicase-related protein [Vibrio crassostreae]|uniref:helicase-related protein n=1 Tax=Vibrio crassostreae TaxID=246167 RepID=UPI001B302782|nr:helicase-related protein [Vibrio crassostreae]
MHFICSQKVSDQLTQVISSEGKYLEALKKIDPKTGINTSMEGVQVLNNVITHQTLTSLGIPTKQKTSHFDPKKTIRFCISPASNVQIWFAYRPNTTVSAYLKEDEVQAFIDKVYSEFESLFSDSDLRLELSKLDMQYLNEENYYRELKKLSRSLNNHIWVQKQHLDVPNLFPVARQLPRKIIVFAGPTSSGKTYHALSLLKAARTGLYLGPLRLNALEVTDELNEEGVPCNLITGEEKVLVEGANHQASTAEMANYNKEVDVVVIDEIQFMDDPDRGWAFCNALIGAPSRFVVVTCPEYAIEKVEKLAGMLGDEIEVHRLPRKTKLTVTPEPVSDFSNLIKGTAIVSFSRKRVFLLKAELEKAYKVSVVYGGMPPDVRKEQARRFREGGTDVVIATDCIGIGLNLPIQHVIFDVAEKFDGVSQRMLHQAEVLQIGGRAGRFKMYDEGFVSARNWKDQSYIRECLGTPDQTTLGDKYYAKVPYSTVENYIDNTGVQYLSVAVKDLSSKISYDKDVYELAPVELLIKNLRFIEKQKLELAHEDVWMIAHIPVEIEDCERTFLDCLSHVSGNEKGVHINTSSLSEKMNDTEKLFELEKLSLQLDCLSWFKNRYSDHFVTIDQSRIDSTKAQMIKAMNDAVLKLK